MEVTCRVIHQIEEYEQAAELEAQIWRFRLHDAIPAHILHALAYNGSLIAAAFHDDRMVGIVVAFPAKYPGGLWSHMAGVHPDYQGQGIGWKLKQYQREWALANKYRTIHWTFDPLQRGNANFNIHKLGAQASIYHVDYYGRMTDAINAGLPSDRLEVIWHLKKSPKRPDYTDVHFLVENHNGKLVQRDLAAEHALVCIEIPFDIQTLKQTAIQQAQAWQLAVRQTMQTAFAQGYSIIDFVVDEGRCWYVLADPTFWYLYVVECADGSLYTGITLDIQRREAQHNAGRGAAYTATRRPVRLLCAWRFPDQGSALRAETAFKQLSRPAKLRTMQNAGIYRDGVLVYPS